MSVRDLIALADARLYRDKAESKANVTGKATSERKLMVAAT